MSRRRPGLALALAAAAVLTACGGSGRGGGAAATPSPLRAAPEPAVAPVPATPPAGRVLPLGVPEPEGIVVDGRTGIAAVATRRPGRLVLLDAADARVLRTVPVPGAARHLQLGAPGGPVLVPGEDTDLLAEVALPDGTVTRTTRVGRQPHDAAAAGDSVFVADELGGAVSVVRDGRVVATFPGPVQPGGVAASGGRVAVVDVRGHLTYVYDAAPPASLGTLPAGDGPTHVLAIGAGVVVVADTAGGALLVTRLGPTPAVTARVALPGRPYGLALDETRRRLFVTTTADNRLVRFDLAGPADAPTLRQIATYPTVQQANSAAVDPRTGRVLVVGATPAGQLQVLDP